MIIHFNYIHDLDDNNNKLLITSPDVGDRFPTLWIDSDFSNFEVIYDDIYYDENMKNRYETGNMLSKDDKKRIIEIGIIYNHPSDLKQSQKIIFIKTIKVKTIR